MGRVIIFRSSLWLKLLSFGTALVFLLVLLPIPPVRAETLPPEFLRKWGTLGSGDGQFNWPVGVAVDASGNVYVADSGNHRIQKFTSSGAFITNWGTQGTGDGGFNRPYGVAVGASGNVYVADSFNNRIHGDIVEIMATRAERGPSRDWLNPVLGYVHTSHAREKIRQWFKKQERTENIERGKELLEKTTKQLGIKLSEREKLAKVFNYDNVDDFYAAIGYGGISAHQIALRLAAQQQPKVTEVTPAQPPTSAVKVRGVGDLLTQLARCCHPLPGDKIVGYVTRTRGVTVHRQDCYNVVHEDEPERLVPVEWGEVAALYPVTIHVRALDRVGLMRDISAVIADEKVNIATVSLSNSDDRTTLAQLTLETANLIQLSRLLNKIEGVRGVISAIRIGEGTSGKSGTQPDIAKSSS